MANSATCREIFFLFVCSQTLRLHSSSLKSDSPRHTFFSEPQTHPVNQFVPGPPTMCSWLCPLYIWQVVPSSYLVGQRMLRGPGEQVRRLRATHKNGRHQFVTKPARKRLKKLPPDHATLIMFSSDPVSDWPTSRFLPGCAPNVPGCPWSLPRSGYALGAALEHSVYVPGCLPLYVWFCAPRTWLALVQRTLGVGEPSARHWNTASSPSRTRSCVGDTVTEIGLPASTGIHLLHTATYRPRTLPGTPLNLHVQVTGSCRVLPKEFGLPHFFGRMTVMFVALQCREGKHNLEMELRHFSPFGQMSLLNRFSQGLTANYPFGLILCASHLTELLSSKLTG